nr:V-type ATP synthase subunit A [Spirochaetaceae bacterium]
MTERIIGTVKRVNGPVIEAKGISDAIMLEMVNVGEARIVGEVSKLIGHNAVIQVYEDTTGIAPGDNIYGSGLPLSVELGPGLIGTIYDGIQRPLEAIYEISKEYIKRGIDVPSLDRKKLWAFTPVPEVIKGCELEQGMVLGTVPETERIVQKILLPPGISGTLSWIIEPGNYTVDTVVAKINT